MASLSDPLDLPSGVRLPNRIAKAALSEALGDADNSPDDRIVTLYRRWAQGGYGLLITGNIMVDRAHLGEPGNIAIEDDRDLPQLTEWTKAAHDGGAAIFAQLNHPGRQSNLPESFRDGFPSVRLSFIPSCRTAGLLCFLPSCFLSCRHVERSD